MHSTLLSSAGISGECDACDYPAEVFRKIVDVNLMGTFLIAQAVAKEMHAAAITGSMVLIASMSGWVANKVCNATLKQKPNRKLTFRATRGSTLPRIMRPSRPYTSSPAHSQLSGDIRRIHSQDEPQATQTQTLTRSARCIHRFE